MKRVAIIGGGITGLAVAFHLQQHAPGVVDYVLIESTDRFGGKIISAQENGFVVEGGPDSFTTYKSTVLDMCQSLGLQTQLVGANGSGQSVFVLSRGALLKMPDGVMLTAATRLLPFLRSPLISWPGKLRMGLEYFIPPRLGEEDESLASFVRRRLGTEALEKIAAPMLASIYAADPEKLSLRSTFPRFLEMERKHGGLLRAAAALKRDQPDRPAEPSPLPLFMTLRGGLQQIVEAIVARLNPSSLLLNRRVRALARENGQYAIALSDGSNLQADELIFATPSPATAELIQFIDPALASSLRAIPYVSSATVSLGFKKIDVPHRLDGFGFLVPRIEQRTMLACSWSSQKFNHRAPEDCVLLRVFMGGAQNQELAEQDEETLIEVALQELNPILGIKGRPVLAKAYRWQKANPQYEVGHQERLEKIDRLLELHPGLHLAGAAYRGAGIPDCVESGVKVAQEIITRARNTDSKTKAAPVSVSKIAGHVASSAMSLPAHRAAHDYARNPLLVYWEMTQACALACRHCRAEAMPCAHPRELSYVESQELLQQIVEFGDPLPHLILTGGDPLQRADLFAVIDSANALGLQVSITPSATPALTRDMIAKFKTHRIQSLGLSLDGSNAARHEAVRSVPGCFDWTMQAARAAADVGMPVQINTLVSQETADDLPAVYELVKTLHPMRWSLFFLIAVGRGKALQELSLERGEPFMHWIYDLARVAPFAVKTTEAPYYRRVALNRMRREGLRPEEIQRTSVYQGFGIRDGHGIVFISNQGDIAPAGFLPLFAGNVRRDKLVDVYRRAPLFQALHTPSRFKGKCGRCEYNGTCGGSRARAYAHTGDPLASDPFCSYEPKSAACS